MVQASRFTLHVWVLIALMVANSCGDVPYSEATHYTINGKASIASSLSSSHVQAFVWDDLSTKGELLGDAHTDGEGNFSLQFNTKSQGPVLLVASGGSYFDHETKKSVELNDSNEISAPLPTLKPTMTVYINAWTTLVVAHAKAHQKGSQNPAEVINKSLNVIGNHFKKNGELAVVSTGLCNPFEECAFGEDGKILGLANIGLSRIAKSLDKTLFEFVTTLTEDLSDGLFDENNSQLLRYDLAKAIHEYIDDYRKLNPIPENYQPEALSKEHGLYDSISTNSNSLLFSSSMEPKRFFAQKPKPDVEVPASFEQPFDLVLNPTFTQPELDLQDLASPSISVFDAYYADSSAKLKNGFVFLHAFLKNGPHTTIEFKVANPSIAHNLTIQPMSRWMYKGSRVEETLCDMRKLDKTREIKPVKLNRTTVVSKYYEYSKNETDKELIPTNGFITIDPGKSVLVKWLAQEYTDNHDSLLKKGELPTHKSCFPSEQKKFYEKCNGKMNYYFFNICTSSEDNDDKNITYYALNKTMINAGVNGQIFYQFRIPGSEVQTKNIILKHPSRTVEN